MNKTTFGILRKGEAQPYIRNMFTKSMFRSVSLIFKLFSCYCRRKLNLKLAWPKRITNFQMCITNNSRHVMEEHEIVKKKNRSKKQKVPLKSFHTTFKVFWCLNTTTLLQFYLIFKFLFRNVHSTIQFLNLVC